MHISTGQIRPTRNAPNSVFPKPLGTRCYSRICVFFCGHIPLLRQLPIPNLNSFILAPIIILLELPNVLSNSLCALFYENRLLLMQLLRELQYVSHLIELDVSGRDVIFQQGDAFRGF